MNIVERNLQLQRELMGISASTMRQLAELSASSTTQYFQTNESFVGKMPSGSEMQNWTEFQREWGEAVWGGYQEYMRESGEILKAALEQSNQLVRDAFTPDADGSSAQEAA